MILSHRFGYSLPPSSCDGEPAPSLALPRPVPIELIVFVPPNGDFIELPVEGSTGDVLLAFEDDRERVPGGCGR